LHQLPFLLRSATRGLGLQVTHRPPVQVPVRPQVAYFIIDIAGGAEHWRHVLDERFLALYLPPPYDPAQLKLEIFAIPAKGGRVRGVVGTRENEDPGAKQVEAEFEGLLRFGSVKPTGFVQYNQILVEIAVAMGEQGAPEPKAFQAVLKTQRTSLSGLMARYNDRGWEQALLERILMPPLRGAEAAVVGASAELAARLFLRGRRPLG
jgi:hypothetical protein